MDQNYKEEGMKESVNYRKKRAQQEAALKPLIKATQRRKGAKNEKERNLWKDKLTALQLTIQHRIQRRFK